MTLASCHANQKFPSATAVEATQCCTLRLSQQPRHVGWFREQAENSLCRRYRGSFGGVKLGGKKC